MNVRSCDVLVIGGGGAGLRAAVAAAEKGASVIVVDKGVIGHAGATFTAASDWMAFGAALGHADPADSSREHWIDIMVKGCLLCRPELARIIAYEAPERLLELDEWGAGFDKTPDGKFVQKLSDGARFPRAAGKGTQTGPAILSALLNRIEQINSDSADGQVELCSDTYVASLLTDGGATIGALAWHIPTGQRVVFSAPSIVLAMGGAGAAYAINVFPPGATGDGYALALRAGAELVNMEFIQIGPSIIHPFPFALSGVFWRLSPRVTNRNGEEFLSQYMPPDADLNEALLLKAVSYPFTVRNISMWIDIAVYTEIAEGRGTDHHGVYMDVSHNAPDLLEREAAVPLHHLRERGLDISRESFEFAPAVQHFNGGVAIDEQAATAVRGLFAAGENAGGQHGADRPGGNSLADCQVFGRRAGISAAAWANHHSTDPEAAREAASSFDLPAASDSPSVEHLHNELSWAMWRNASVVRDADGLEQAAQVAQRVREQALSASAQHPWQRLELYNCALVSEAVARAALRRTESRGTHYRRDCQAINDPSLQRQIFWQLRDDELSMRIGPIIQPPPELPDLPKMLEAAYSQSPPGRAQ